MTTGDLLIRAECELMPCPFCGGKVGLADMGHFYTVTRLKGYRRDTLFCRCRVFFESDNYEDTKEDRKEKLDALVKAWNTRT